MIHVTPEGHITKPGINFYPLSAWRHMIGFRLRLGKLRLMARIALHAKRIYFQTWTWKP